VTAAAILVGASVWRFGSGTDSSVESWSAGSLGQAVCYQPRGFDYTGGAPCPSVSQIKADLKLLRSQGFRSLLTYSSLGSLGDVPLEARQAGFDRIIIMGIWDPTSQEEIDHAVAQAPFVDLYCIGNEGLGSRYSRIELSRCLTLVRQKTGVRVTTSEPIQAYFQGPDSDWLRQCSDIVLPTAHPFWSGIHDPERAVEWIVMRFDLLSALSLRSVVLKEVGLPTGGSADCHEHLQAVFFREMRSSDLPFFYLEAFDQPGKRVGRAHPAIEAQWGINHSDGTPKQASRELMEIGMP
jgi:exo-beta-1,3-glucanase (GH17 family)